METQRPKNERKSTDVTTAIANPVAKRFDTDAITDATIDELANIIAAKLQSCKSKDSRRK